MNNQEIIEKQHEEIRALQKECSNTQEELERTQDELITCKADRDTRALETRQARHDHGDTHSAYIKYWNRYRKWRVMYLRLLTKVVNKRCE